VNSQAKEVLRYRKLWPDGDEREMERYPLIRVSSRQSILLAFFRERNEFWYHNLFIIPPEIDSAFSFPYKLSILFIPSLLRFPSAW
jgi:hypothetical protein